MACIDPRLLSSATPASSDYTDEETVRTTQQLIPISFSHDYDSTKRRSEMLRAISTVTDARTHLTREQLEADLLSMPPQARGYAQALIAGPTHQSATKSIYERESGLRYWLVSNAGSKQLFCEWIRLFQSCPGYLSLVPFDVQEMVESLHSAPADVQRKALAVNLRSSPSSTSPTSSTPTTRKRSHAATEEDDSGPGIQSSITAGQPPAKRARVTNTAKHSDATATVLKVTDGVRGRKRVRWSQSRINAWEKIKGVSRSDLPSSAFDKDEHELESHCTPVAADIRFCNYPLSIEEILTYFPEHTYWREPMQRLASTGKQHYFFHIYRKSLERTNLQKRMTVAKNISFLTHTTTASGSMENISDASGMDNAQPYDVFVCDLAKGVRHHPTGKGAQLLTRVVEHALAHEDPYVRRLKLSEVAAYAAFHNITVPAEDKMGQIAEEEDKAARERHEGPIGEWYAKDTIV